MKTVAILLSGHLRNFEDIINNFKDNFINIISQEFNYDIFIHTWDNNFTNDKYMNNDSNFKNIIINYDYIQNLFRRNKIVIKKIIIENQIQLYNKLNIDLYLYNNICDKSIHNNFDNNYVKDLTNKLFWQFYGHSKLIANIDNIDSYNYIIKTRPDMYYEKFNNTLFNYDIFFPHTHQGNNNNINQLFFGGKTEYIKNILRFFDIVIFSNNNINFDIVHLYHETDINFNNLFRFYIINYLKYVPYFIKYSPNIYRNNNNITLLK